MAVYENLDVHTALIISDFAEKMAEWAEQTAAESKHYETALEFRARAQAFWVVRGYIQDAIYEDGTENEQVES